MKSSYSTGEPLRFPMQLVHDPEIVRQDREYAAGRWFAIGAGVLIMRLRPAMSWEFSF